MHLRSRTDAYRLSQLHKAIVPYWHGPIEALEPRRLLSGSSLTTLYPIAALFANSPTGWSQLPAQTNGRTIYVSSSEGDDGNNGLSADTPVATIAHAKKLMRDGHDDWMLLLRGDVWDEPIGAWTTSGVSPTDPQVISYYSPDPSNPTAGDRPLIDSGTNDGIYFTGHASDVAIIGLQFTPNSINGTSYDGHNSTGICGMRFQLTGHDYLVEDCLVDGYKDNIGVGNPGSPVTDFVIHRSESLDSYNLTGAHSQGLYISGVCSNVLISENTFDHNGWKVATDKTFFNHDMYINTGAQNVEVLDNVITRAALRGTLLRAGGIVEGNFYDQDAVGIQVDNMDSTVDDNVILEGDDLPSLPSGVGIDVSFDMDNVDIENNIVAHDISDYTSNVSGIDVEPGTGAATLKNDIVYDWRRPLIDGTNDGMTATDNDFEEFSAHHPVINVRDTVTTGEYSDNTYYNPSESASFEIGNNINTKISYPAWVSKTGDNSGFIGFGNTAGPDYLDPNRTMASYAAFLGLPASQQTFNGWVAQQRSQYNGNWNTQFTATAENAYIRAGFTASGAQQAGIPRVQVLASTLGGVDNSTITETSGTGVFTLTRYSIDGANVDDSTLSVNYSISGTATNGVDYTLSPATAFFGIGVDQITIDVNPIHDKNPDGTFNVEQPETVKLDITASSANPPTYIPDTDATATITINDVDGGNQPTNPGGNNPSPPDDNGGGSGGLNGSPPSGTGLTASFFNNQDLVGSPVYTTTVTSVGFNSSAGLVTPDNNPAVNLDHSSVAYTGKIQPPNDGKYTFTIDIDADAAVRLYVDDGSQQPQIDLRPNHRSGDANDDSSVDSQDFAILAAHYNQATPYWDQGDFNGDGTVNALDFNALATNYGTNDPRQSQSLTGTVSLEGGAAYNIVLEYSQKVGPATLSFDWSGPNLVESAPATNRLYTGSGPPSLSTFAPDMSDSVEASALPDATASSSVFSSTSIAASAKDVIG